MRVPEARFGDFARQFWDHCSGGDREDVGDSGGEYRSAVGLPGGIKSPLLADLRKNAGSVKLVSGRGGDQDTEGQGKVFVYDTATFPAHTAEKYHQFHDDMMEAYGYKYNALDKWAAQTACPGDTSSIFQ
jgi:hypothetical protein